MVIDLDTYAANKKYIQDHVLRHGKKDPGFAIAMVSAVTHVPVIVCAYWAGEVLDWPESIVKTIKGLIDFYSYSEIKNRPKNAPI